MDALHYLDITNSIYNESNRVSQMEAVQKEGLELFKKKMQIMEMHLQIMV